MALSEDIKRGTVELLILTLLQDQDMYGYQLSQELTNRSNGLYTLQKSSMYPTLYRLVEKGRGMLFILGITEIKDLEEEHYDNPEHTMEDVPEHFGLLENFTDKCLLQ